jgi:hypothetical protein
MARSSPYLKRVVRDSFGRAHYSRMQEGARLAGLDLPAWEHLTPAQREAHRKLTDWLIPVAMEIVTTLAKYVTTDKEATPS